MRRSCRYYSGRLGCTQRLATTRPWALTAGRSPLRVVDPDDIIVDHLHAQHPEGIHGLVHLQVTGPNYDIGVGEYPMNPEPVIVLVLLYLAR